MRYIVTTEYTEQISLLSYDSDILTPFSWLKFLDSIYVLQFFSFSVCILLNCALHKAVMIYCCILSSFLITEGTMKFVCMYVTEHQLHG